MSSRRKLRTDASVFDPVVDQPPTEEPPGAGGGVQEPLPDGEIGDTRVVALMEDGNLSEAVETALVDADEPFAVSKLLDIADAVRTIRSGQATVQNAAVEIGNALNKLFDLVGHGGFRALKEKGLVAMSEGNVSIYRSVARLVADGMVERDLLPHSISAAYALAKQPREVVGRLIESGDVKPEATKKGITEAAERVLRQASGAPRKRIDLKKLDRRIADLQAELDRLRRIREEAEA